MPPKKTERAAKYASKTRQKSQKTADLNQKQPFFVYQNYIYCAAANAEKFESFGANFLSEKAQVVHFNLLRKSISRSKE